MNFLDIESDGRFQGTSDFEREMATLEDRALMDPAVEEVVFELPFQHDGAYAVSVRFAHGDVRQPVVIGSLWSSADAPPR